MERRVAGHLPSYPIDRSLFVGVCALLPAPQRDTLVAAAPLVAD